jgi:hypothetical protein
VREDNVHLGWGQVKTSTNTSLPSNQLGLEAVNNSPSLRFAHILSLSGNRACERREARRLDQASLMPHTQKGGGSEDGLCALIK